MAKIKARHAFIHGAHNLERGDEITVSAVLARELQKQGLIEDFEDGDDEDTDKHETKKAPEPANKKAPEPANKAAGKK